MGGSSGSESDSDSGRSNRSHKKEKKVKKDKKKSGSGDEHEKKEKKEKKKSESGDEHEKGKKDKKDKDKKDKKDDKDKKDKKDDKDKKDKKEDKDDKDKDKKDKKDDDKKSGSHLPAQLSHALSGLGLGGIEQALQGKGHGLLREGGAPATGVGPAPTIPSNPSTGPGTGVSGQRIPCTTSDPFPAQAVGPAPPFVDSTGQPVYVGSALISDTNVQPCRITPSGCFIASDGVEAPHTGRYDLLPLTDAMEWVPASGGAPPSGKRVVEGGIENGSSLYHACARVNSVMLPGKAGPSIGGARIPGGGAAHFFPQDYFVLCWKE